MSYITQPLSDKQIEAKLKKMDNPQKLKRIHSLSWFWNKAYFPSTYCVSTVWSRIVKLSPYGKFIVNKHFRSLYKKNEGLFNFCLFRIFTYHDLFIDYDNCLIDEIEKQLEQEMISNKIFFPHMLGKSLYDKYNNKFPGEKRDALTEEEVLELITDMPQGIYQIGEYLIGPNGLLHSYEHRHFPPVLSLPLWHCPDPGCRAIHKIQFDSYLGELQGTDAEIRKKLMIYYGRCSDWEHRLAVYFYRVDEIRDLKGDYIDLAALLVDCLTDLEIDKIFKVIISSAYFEKIRNDEHVIKLKRSDLLSLDHSSKLQLFLLFPDKDLVNVIERCLDEGIIDIPIGQRRKAKHIPPLPSTSSNTILSRYGFMVDEGEPAIEFILLIKEAYEKCTALIDLLWKLKINTDANLDEALYDYLRSNNPAFIIEQLVIGNKMVCSFICQKLNLSVNPLSCKDIFINRLLWRLGYEPQYSNDDLINFKKWIIKFQDVVLSLENPITESDRAKIRSIGVNLFVSMEDYLDKLLTYNVWLLSSDHIKDTNFAYDYRKARNSVSELLGDKILSNDIEFSWDNSGNNTLGVLMCYLSSFVRWLKGLQQENVSHYKKSSRELPHYVVSGKNRAPYLYLHKQLWADIDTTNREKYITHFEQIYKLLAQSNMAAIRNGLDHKREASNFPNVDAMISCITHISKVLLQAQSNRFYPDPLWLSEYKKNSFGIEEYIFTNNNNIPVILNGPISHISLFEPIFNILYLIAPIRITSDPNSHIIIKYKVTNEYDDYWSDYGRKDQE